MDTVVSWGLRGGGGIFSFKTVNSAFIESKNLQEQNYDEII